MPSTYTTTFTLCSLSINDFILHKLIQKRGKEWLILRDKRVLKYLERKKTIYLDHFCGWRIRAEVRGRYQFVSGACPQPQQHPPMLLSSDRLGLHRDQDRPVLSVPSDQVHVLLRTKTFRFNEAHFSFLRLRPLNATTDRLLEDRARKA